MRVTINIEFTDQEIVKHAEDLGRRWVLNCIRDVLNNPAMSSVVKQAAKGVMDAVAETPGYVPPDPTHGWDPRDTTTPPDSAA